MHIAYIVYLTYSIF